MAKTDYDWTDERVALLLKRWRQQKTASEIATELPGDVSKSMVLSKVRRLGMAKRGTARGGYGAVAKTLAVPPPQPEAEPARPRPQLVVGERPSLFAAEAILGTTVGEYPDLLELRDHHCRMPMPGRSERGFGVFCGARRAVGKVLSFCDEHYAVVTEARRGPAVGSFREAAE